MVKWAWVSDSVKEGGEQKSSGSSFHYRCSLMVKACFHWVNVYPSIRKEEARHKQEYRVQHGQGNNELLPTSLLSCLGHSQCSLEPGWCAGELNALGQVVLYASTEKLAFILYSKQERKNQQWKYLNNLFKHLVDCTEGRQPESSCWEWAMKRWRRLVGSSVDFFVMGCQNGFDLLRDLLIINCIICFLLYTSQEKQTPTLHPRPGHNSYHQRGWLDVSWLCKLSADGS